MGNTTSETINNAAFETIKEFVRTAQHDHDEFIALRFLNLTDTEIIFELDCIDEDGDPATYHYSLAL